MELYRYTAMALARMLRAGEVSAVEITAASLAHIAKTEPLIEAYLTITEREALAVAAAVDKKRLAGQTLAPLAGIPIAVKDNICTSGVRTTCASRMLQDFVPPYDATVIAKLKAQDAVLTGKVNLDEFAMGSSCENSRFKATHNPWDTARVPGGSSGGSAAAVASCEVPLALGSDSGGSIRCPASFCGVVGLRPTYGAVSRYGMVAFASSLDQIGPLARTVDDAALLFCAIAGADKAHDATSVDYTYGAPINDVKGLRIGIPVEYFGDGISEPVRKAVLAATQIYRMLGADVFEVSLPSTAHALAAYHVIASSEAASNLGRFDGLRYGYRSSDARDLSALYRSSRTEGFGAEVQRRILLGTHMLCAGDGGDYYKRAGLLRQQTAAEFDTVFEKCDILATPTCPTTAFFAGERHEDPLTMYAADMCAGNVSLAGLPGLSIPCGFDEAGMPVGLQLIGPKWSEATLFGAAKCYETAVGGFAVKEL